MQYASWILAGMKESFSDMHFSKSSLAWVSLSDRKLIWNRGKKKWISGQMAQYSVIKKEHFEFQCVWQQSTNWGPYFYVSGPPFYVVIRATVQYSAKGVTSFLGYFTTLSIGLALRIKPTTSPAAVKCFTGWDNPAAVRKWFFPYFL